MQGVGTGAKEQSVFVGAEARAEAGVCTQNFGGAGAGTKAALLVNSSSLR